MSGEATRDFSYRFWVNYQGSFSELIEEIIAKTGGLILFSKDPKEVTHKDMARVGECKVSVKTNANHENKSPHFGEHHIMYPMLNWATLSYPKEHTNYIIEFLSYYDFNTVKTRYQMSKLAYMMPGNDAIMSIEDYAVGSRIDGEWNFGEPDEWPAFVQKRWLRDLDVTYRERQLLHLRDVFRMEETSMFDNGLHTPFNMSGGFEQARCDWKIWTSNSVVEVAVKIAHNFSEDSRYTTRAYPDLSEEYFVVQAWNDQENIELVVQSSDYFVVPGNDIQEEGTVIISMQYRDDIQEAVRDAEHNAVVEKVRMLGLPYEEWFELQQVIDKG